VRALCERVGEGLLSRTELLAGLSVGDSEATLGRASGLRVVRCRGPISLFEHRSLRPDDVHLRVKGSSLGVGDGSCRVVGLHPILHEGVQVVLLAQVLEEVLLAPSLEHAVGDR
jgi:hypothetical protein